MFDSAATPEARQALAHACPDGRVNDESGARSQPYYFGIGSHTGNTIRQFRYVIAVAIISGAFAQCSTLDKETSMPTVIASHAVFGKDRSTGRRVVLAATPYGVIA